MPPTLTHDEIVRLYGPWEVRTPDDAAHLMEGYPGQWWVAGGWAIEAFSGVSRPHGDLDLGVPRDEVPLLQQHLAGRLDVWEADDGALRPLLSDTPAAGPPSCDNLWLRRSGGEPWEYDLQLTDVVDGTWLYKRDHGLTWSLGAALWRRDGIAHLRPEMQLLHKARGRRPQDEDDLRAALPLLDDAARHWLAAALERTEPGHPWLAEVSPSGPRA